MARLLILFLAATTVGCITRAQVHSSDLATAEEWNDLYETFMNFDAKQNEDLIFNRTLLSIAKLHEASSELPYDDRRELVEFLFDSTTDSTEHCSSLHLDKLSYVCEDFAQRRHEPMMVFCKRISKRVPDNCFKRFVDAMGKQSSSALTEEEREDLLELTQLGSIVGPEAVESFDDFKLAWFAGPCKKVLLSFLGFMEAN